MTSRLSKHVADNQQLKCVRCMPGGRGEGGGAVKDNTLQRKNTQGLYYFT